MTRSVPTRWTTRYIPAGQRRPVAVGRPPPSGISGEHKIIGYQPAPPNPRARKPYEPHGWLVVLVNEAISTPQPMRLRRTRTRRLRVA